MKEININNFSEKLYYEKLSNGLNIYMLPYKYKKNFFCLMLTKFGGKDLEFNYNNKKYKVPSGVAHFLEHKLFEGSNKKPFNFYAKSGCDVNASTNYDYTAYYFMGNESFNKNLKYLINWINEFDIDDEKVEKEKGIILEEASMYKDNDYRVLYSTIYNNTLVNSSLKYKVIGSDSDIKSITKEDLKLCYDAFYNPSNMYLFIVGNFDKDKTLDLVESEYKKFSYPKINVEKVIKEEPDEVSKKFDVIKKDIEISKLAICYKMNKELFNLGIDKYLLDYYLYMILSIGFGNTSDFYERLYKDKVFTSLGFQLDDIPSHYLLLFYVNSKDPDKFLDNINQYIKDIELKEEAFIRMKKTWISAEVKMIDSINSTLYNIVDDIIDYGEYKNNKIEDIRSLKYEDLLKVKAKLSFTNNSVVIMKK